MPNDSPMKQAGFSYLWLLFLVALVGAGLAAVADATGLERRRMQERQLIFAGHQIRDAIQRYRDNTPPGRTPEYPARLADLLDDRRGSLPMFHLRRLYSDPLTGNNDWGLVILDGRIAGVFSRSSQMPLKQDNFEAPDLAFAGARRYSEWRFTYPAALASTAN